MAIGCKSVVPPGQLPLNFRLEGIEPKDDPRWRLADPIERARFWKIAGRIAKEVKQRELRRGLDYAGRPLKPVRLRNARYKSGRRLDGDPLMPHRALSRTRRLLRYVVNRTSITFYWALGWGKILDYHRRGACIVRNGRAVGRLPVRNVFGISAAGRREIARRALAHWRSGTMPEKKDNLANETGLSVNLPADPAGGFDMNRPRKLTGGSKLVRHVSKNRVVNPGAGIQGATSGNYAIKIDWTDHKWAK